MLPLLVNNLFFPLNETLRGYHTAQFIAELEKTQWYTPGQIRELQLRKLTKLIHHAYEAVPYYRQVFDRFGLKPQDVMSLDDLRKIPLLTKRDIRANLNQLTALGSMNELTRSNTGGSTGSPLIFYVDKSRVGYDRAARIRSRRWWGIGISDKEVALWGAPNEVTKQGWVRDCRDRFLNTKFLSAFNMNDDSMLKYAEIIRHYHPRHIFGYPSSIYAFCRFLGKKGIELKDVGIKVVFVTGEILYDYQKEVIKSTFKCDVANGYGGRDGGFIAHECPHGSMHITAENIIVEFIKDNECISGTERGEIVVTHLDSYGMPFIRYRMGDIGSPGNHIQCKCGRGLPLLNVVEGRSTDFIVTPHGRIMHGLALIYILRDIEGIDRFRIIQPAEDELLIQIVRDSTFECSIEEEIKTAVEKKMGAHVKINIEYVGDGDLEESGKYRYVVSQVASKYI
jgi:phenylacetate-CoA ligase